MEEGHKLGRMEEHDWFMPSFTSQWEACRKCGVVKRADGQNGPCRGLVEIAMRETDQAGMGGERRKGERRDAWRTEMTAKDQRDDPDYAGKCYRPFEYNVHPGDRVRYVTQPDRRRAERRKGE